LLIRDYLPLLTNTGVTMTRTMPYTMLLTSGSRSSSDFEENSSGSNEINSPSNVEVHIGSSSEELVGMAENYNEAELFFEFVDFGTDIAYDSIM